MIFGLNIPIICCFVLQNAFATAPEVDLNCSIRTVRQWIDEGFIVGSKEKSLSDEVTGVCVVLRHNGALLGYGEAFGDNQDLLILAANIALGEARKNAILRKLPEDIRNHAVSSIGIEVGIASEIIPIPSKNLEKAAKKIITSVDGIAVRRGDSWDYRLPSQMTLSPFRSTVNHFEGMCIKVGAPAAAAIAHQFSSNENITFYRLKFTAAYQHAKGERVQLLYRGDELVSLMKLQQEGIQEVADLLASYLINSLWQGDEAFGITGTYQPETDRLNTIFAPVISQAMAAEALLNYSSIPKCLHKQNAVDAYKRIMNDLAIVNKNESPITGVVEQSFVVLASGSGITLSENATSMIANCRDAVIKAAKQMVNEANIPSKPLVRGVLSAAIAHVAKQEHSFTSLAEKVIEACITATNDNEQTALIPWIAQASVDTTKLGGKVNIEFIKELRSNALSSQVTDNSIPDLLGGYSLTTKEGSIVDARGIRVIPMLAELLPVETYTPLGNRFDELQTMLLSARFTSQLTTTTERSNRFPNPNRAVGGVRSSPWDATMRPEAAAMALIGITKAIDSIYAVARGE